MENKKYLYKIFAFILVFEIFSISCHGQSIDSRLNGTWILKIPNGEYCFIFNNGNYEETYNGRILFKGTYTTNDSIITFKKTHISFKKTVGEYELYSEDEYKEKYSEIGTYLLFNKEIFSYSINVNTFTIINNAGTVRVNYTRKETIELFNNNDK